MTDSNKMFFDELSGPAFEPSRTEMCKSEFNREGMHYNIFAVNEGLGMSFLRKFFPDGEATQFVQCIFSTSGVHGTYSTIEECEQSMHNNLTEDDDNCVNSITFLVIQPRVVCMHYGNCAPQTLDDIEFLKRIRESSTKQLSKIGYQL